MASIKKAVGTKSISVEIFPKPAYRDRAPTIHDIHYKVRQMWVFEDAVNGDSVYMLTAKRNNQAIWLFLGGSAVIYESFSVTQSFSAEMSNTATSQFVVETGDNTALAIDLDASTNGGGFTFTAGVAGGHIAGTDLTFDTAGKGVKFLAGPKLISYSGDPSGVVVADKGTLCLNPVGSAVNDRMYVNTDGATAWTHVTTGA